MLRGICAGILLSIAVALVIPQKYQSTVRLIPPDPQARASNTLLASAMGGNPDGERARAEQPGQHEIAQRGVSGHPE